MFLFLRNFLIESTPSKALKLLRREGSLCVEESAKGTLQMREKKKNSPEDIR